MSKPFHSAPGVTRASCFWRNPFRFCYLAAPVQSSGLDFFRLKVLILPPSRVLPVRPLHSQDQTQPPLCWCQRGISPRQFSPPRQQVLTAEPFHTPLGQRPAGNQGQTQSLKILPAPVRRDLEGLLTPCISCVLAHRAPDCAILCRSTCEVLQHDSTSLSKM